MPTSYRGRLIFPMRVSIARLDTSGIAAADPDGAGPLESGYDEDFREPRRIEDGTQEGRSGRLELPPVMLLAQVEDLDWESLAMSATGNDPSTGVSLVFHVADLEHAGFVDSTSGTITCPIVGDRLVSIIDPRSGAVEQMAPGLYCVHAQPRSYGLGARRRNLLVATFSDRDRSVQR